MKLRHSPLHVIEEELILHLILLIDDLHFLLPKDPHPNVWSLDILTGV